MNATDIQKHSLKKKKRIFYLKLLLLAAMSAAVSAFAALWVAEKFFFDKFFYYKSVAHGYRIPGKELSIEDFGRRGKDIEELIEYSQSLTEGKPFAARILGETKAETYTIAVIGDSFIWGQGLREKNRLVNILESKLNKQRPTKILSLALGGDSIVDNYIKYKLISAKNPNIDLFIFGLGRNDLLLNEKTRYNPKIFDDLISGCTDKKLIYDVDIKPYTTEYEDSGHFYEQLIQESTSPDSGNICIFNKLINMLPRDKAIYFDFGQHFNGSDYNGQALRYITDLKTNGFFILSPNDYIDDYFQDKNKTRKELYVSETEMHPSTLANNIFANVLFQEITQNPRWKFSDLTAMTKVNQE